MRLPLLEDLGPVAGKRVLVRCDFNVPISGGVITDDLRMRLPLDTLVWLLDQGAEKLTVCSHLGRPKGKPDPKYTVEPVRQRLYELLEVRGADTKRVELLENLRYNVGEEVNAPEFVASLIENEDLYVDDAFGAAHRAHASIVGPPAFLPSAAGRVLAREVDVLDGVLTNPSGPSWPSSAGRRSRTSWASLKPCWTRWTPCWWAAECALRSWPPRAIP